MAAVGHWVEYILARSGAGLVARLSLRQVDRLAEALGSAAYRLWGSRRRIALDNLRQSLGGEYPEPQRKHLARRVFQNMARSVLEFAWFGQSQEPGHWDIVHGAGMEAVEQALQRGKGAIICTAHFGNWELCGAWFGRHGYPMDFLVAIQHNPLVDRMVTQFRNHMGIEVIPNTVGARGIFRALKNNRLVGIAADQHTGSGLPISFLGRTAFAARGPALFAGRTGAPMIPVLLRRERYDRHVMITREPIYVEADSSTDPDRKVDEATVMLHGFFEETIRRYPDQWMWTHRRWKSGQKESNL